MDEIRDYNSVLNEEIRNAEFLHQLSQLAVACSDLLKPAVEKSGSAEDKASFSELLNNVVAQTKSRETYYRSIIDKQKSCNQINANKHDSLALPPPGQGTTSLDYKELKTAVGELNDENKHNIKSFCNRLYTYGQREDFDYNDYKAALSILFNGQLLTELSQMNKEDFPYIINWFYEVYHIPETLSTLKLQLRNFVRTPNEPINICMKRYQLPARRADNHLPENEKHYDTPRHLSQVVQKFVQEPAKSHLIKWKNYQLESGRSFTYDELLDKALQLERYHACIPNKEISHLPAYEETDFVSPDSDHEIHSSELLPPENNTSSISSSQENNTAVKRPKIRNSKPYLRHVDKSSIREHIDPVKATGNRPSYYNSQNHRDQPSRKDNNYRPPSERSQSYRSPNTSSWNSRSSPFRNFNPNHNKPDSKPYSKEQRQDFRHESQRRHSSTSSSSSRNFDYNRTPQSQYRPGQAYNNQSSFRKNSHPHQLSQSSSGHYSSPKPYPPSQKSTNYSPHYRNKSAQYDVPSNKPPPYKRPYYGHNKVRKDLFCARCGTSKKAASDFFANSDHSTYDCMVYKLHNPHGCSICLALDIDAKHYPHECKQRRATE